MLKLSEQEGGHWRACPTLRICRMQGKGGRNWHDLLRANWAKSGASSATSDPGRLPHCGRHGPLPMPPMPPMPCPALRSSSPWPWRSAAQKPPRRRRRKACFSAICPQRSLVAGAQAITVRSGVCARDYGAPVRGGTRISQDPLLDIRSESAAPGSSFPASTFLHGDPARHQWQDAGNSRRLVGGG